MFQAIEEALLILNNSFGYDDYMVNQARMYVARNATMDMIGGYGLDPMHMAWFGQHHRHHHYGVGGLGYNQETIIDNGRLGETIIENSPYGQEIIETGPYGTNIIDTDW